MEVRWLSTPSKKNIEAVRDWIEDTWLETTHFFKKVRSLFHNIWKFRKILWRDRDWDQGFFYELLEFKLRSIHKYFSSDAPVSLCSQRKKYRRNILVCAELVKRIREENYFKYYYRDVDCSWDANWEIDPEKPTRYRMKEKTKEQGPKSYWGYIEQKQLNEIEKQMKKQDQDLLFKLLTKHLDTWWD